jgi:hypothetical protein
MSSDAERGYVARYEDWPKKVFCRVVKNAEGEFDLVGESGTVLYTSPLESEAQQHADYRNRFNNHQQWLRQVPYPLPPDHPR